MDSHKNARLTQKGREEMMRAVVNGVQSYAAAARKFNTTPKTSPNGSNAAAQKAWMGCVITLKISSSDSQTSQVTCDAIEVLRRQRYTGKHIAAEVGVSPQLSAASSNGVDSISSAP